MQSTDLWKTPQYFFDKLNDEFHFDYDVCQDGENGLAPYLGDYFSSHYKDCICFMNPPYNEPNKFVDRAIELTESNVVTVALLKSDTSTKLFHKLYYDKRYEIRFIKGRIYFINQNGKTGSPNFANLIAIIKRLTWINE